MQLRYQLSKSGRVKDRGRAGPHTLRNDAAGHQSLYSTDSKADLRFDGAADCSSKIALPAIDCLVKHG